MTSLDFHKLCHLAYCLILYVQLLSLPSYAAFASASATSTTEAEALLKWKATFQNHTQPQNLTSWTYLPMNTKAAPCFWYFMQCCWKRTLHEFSFFSFPNLQHLNLSYNNLFNVIPARISSLSKLIHLEFSNNQLSGSIPTSVGDLTNLISTLIIFLVQFR
ncbi:unnamed protein product [Malus baccata var. baccata]